MECLVVFFVFGCAAAYVFYLLFAQSPAADEGLRVIAKRFGGSYFHRTWFRTSSVAFRYGIVSALLRVQRRAGRSWLELAVYAKYSDSRLEVFPQEDSGLREFAYDRSLVTMQTLTCGRYDYVIRSEPASYAAVFLTDAVARQLETLMLAAKGTALTITLQPDQLTVRKSWSSALRSSEAMLEYVLEALRLHDHIQLSRAEGIAFVDTATTESVEHEKCAICGEAIGDAYVTCRQCQAPHHLDCWRYNGSCGMFACRGQKYEVAHRSMRSKPR